MPPNQTELPLLPKNTDAIQPKQTIETILIVNDNMRTNINGLVTMFDNIEYFAHRDGYRFVYLTPSEFPRFDCPGYPDIKLSLPFGFENKIQKIRPDYVHIATEGPLGLMTTIYCDRNNIRYNTGYHTKIPEYIQVMFGLPESIGYAYLRWFHRNSARVLTTSSTMVSELENRGFYNHIKPMTFGVDRTIFRSSLRRDDFKGCERPILLSVGRVSKEKGLDDFCQLDYPGTKIVVGDGAYRNELQQKYPNVVFTGFQRGKALAEYYANADCLVFPSRTDTFGVVIIEALAVGTPVAAYHVTGPKDILEQNVTGVMGEDLKLNVDACLKLDRNAVELASACWSWENCWNIFRRHLIKRDHKAISY
ncbi:GDP-mannose-dependent alpha-mannosyltransferase [Thraustotheca clavata]|uniref:GDP-mannose-dependent alpha-mannosyltransferase n=1 Tax=Thraustotheca clavata TaxID=74557 RepID=A0A1V9ZX88_9STRA|nr:GDP-mannose-dependent alpha-mannosyltransferase [Thraustotheca clavata]